MLMRYKMSQHIRRQLTRSHYAQRPITSLSIVAGGGSSARNEPSIYMDGCELRASRVHRAGLFDAAPQGG